MEGLIEKTAFFIISPSFGPWLQILRIGFLVLAAAFLWMIVFAFLKTAWFKFLLLEDVAEFVTFRPFGVRRIVKMWQKIKVRLETGMESEYKLAVIEGDGMMDDILKRMGYKGETLGERLKNLTSATLPNIEDIQRAHQTRNNIVHDPDYRLSLDEARKTLAIHEKALQDLQAF